MVIKSEPRALLKCCEENTLHVSSVLTQGGSSKKCVFWKMLFESGVGQCNKTQKCIL